MDNWMETLLEDLLKIHRERLVHKRNPTPESALEAVYASGERAGILKAVSELHAGGLITAEDHSRIYAKTLGQINTENT